MTTKSELLKLVRQHCGECFGQSENDPYPVEDVKGCSSPKCVFYDFRFGKDPYPNPNKSKAARNRLNSVTGGRFVNENQR